MKQYHDLPRDERAKIMAIALGSTEEERKKALSEYCLLRKTKRMYQRRRREEDRYKRTMLAIHVPLDYAFEVSARADAEGMSVYAWMRRAIDRAIQGDTCSPKEG